MKIRMTKTVVSGDKDGNRETLKGGDVVEMKAADAKKLIEAGHAVEVSASEAKAETADADGGSDE